LRDRYDDIKARGAEVVAIGQGFPEMAADFKRKRKIPFPLLVDQDRVTYKAMSLGKGSALDIFGPQVLAKGTLSFVKGHLQGLAPEGTSMRQLGGALIVDRGGTVLLSHQSSDASDNLPVDHLIAALP
jgi:hypothetical protein